MRCSANDCTNAGDDADGRPVRPSAAFLTLWLLAALLSGPVRAEVVVIHAGQLLAEPGEPPRTGQTLVIRDGRITDIRDGYHAPGAADMPGVGTRVVDLSDRFVMPGLIDLHVHTTMQPLPGEYLGFVRDSDADLALVGAMNLRRNLAAGFTTVLDLGRPGTPAHVSAVFALRAAIAAGRVVGPRVLATGGPISATGLSRHPPYRSELDSLAGPVGVCNGAEGCRRAVRERVKAGADLISFYNTGSLLFPGGVAQAMTDEEMSAIVETAHSLGRRVIADGHHAAGVEAALSAGADSVDSLHYATDETLAKILETGRYMQSHIYAVTASVGDTLDTLSDGIVYWHPRPVLQRLFEIKQQPFAVVRAYRAGIRRIAFASDVGNFPHGDNARDLIEYVRRGIPAAFALRTATRNAAEALGLEAEIGTLAPGRQADIIALASSPLDDIEAILDVVFVMRAGRIYSAAELENPEPRR